jgi:hypothetical protein
MFRNSTEKPCQRYTTPDLLELDGFVASRSGQSGIGCREVFGLLSRGPHNGLQ